jgi:uncharacterized membrane protein YvbJ
VDWYAFFKQGRIEMKRIISLAICIVIAAVVCITASAAGLDVNKKKVLDSLKNRITVGDKTTGLSEELITQTENFLKRDDVVITSEQADQIVKHINSSIKTVKDSGSTSISDLSLKDKTAILNDIKSAADVIGLSVAVNSTDNTITILKDNIPVATNEAVLKITGPDTSTIDILAGVFVVLFAGCFVAAWKAGLLIK